MSDQTETERFILYETGDGYCSTCLHSYYAYDDMVSKLREQAACIEELEADLAAAVVIIRHQAEHIPDWQFDSDPTVDDGEDRADWLAWRLNADAATIRRLLKDSDHE